MILGPHFDGKSVLASPPPKLPPKADPRHGAITQYDRRATFTRQEQLVAYAARADFKFEMYSMYTRVDSDRADSYFLIGHGVDTIDKAINLIKSDPRGYALITDGWGLVLKLSIADLTYLREQYVLLYGEVNKPGFDTPNQ